MRSKINIKNSDPIPLSVYKQIKELFVIYDKENKQYVTLSDANNIYITLGYNLDINLLDAFFKGRGHLISARLKLDDVIHGYQVFCQKSTKYPSFVEYIIDKCRIPNEYKADISGTLKFKESKTS